MKSNLEKIQLVSSVSIEGKSLIPNGIISQNTKKKNNFI